jgi:site-specific DNA-cytosine methylase
MHHHPVNLVEFCAGYCGIGIGLKSVVRNLRTIAYVEREAYPVANLAAKIEAGRLDAAPIWSDLLDFPYGKFRGLVDIAAAGIPCQPHSHAGLRKGGGDERFLFGDWLRGLQQMRPRCILIENVEGLLTSQMPDGTLCIRWTLERLERMGYRTASGIFSAEECGAPHIRKRVFSFWPTPTANEDKDQNASFATLSRLDKGGRILRRIATLAMRGNGQVGQSNLNDGGNRRERLNPAWVESLLGLPSSWTDCASSETESCQQPPLSPSAL